MKPKFLFCVGAQKSGTTMLHDVLSKLPNANFGPVKEYHIFDTETVDLKLMRRSISQSGKFFNVWTRKAAMQRLPFFYEAYFRWLVRGKALTGDITPGYAGLTSDQFAQIRRRLTRVGFDVKLLFIMRDPVTRCHSMAKMWNKGFLRNKQISDNELLEIMYNHPRCEMRTRYELTLHSLEKAMFAQKLFLFNEDLGNSVPLINNFLGLSLQESALQQVKFSNKSAEPIPQQLKERITRHYCKTYEYCFDRFPITQKLWAEAFSILN